MNGSDRAGEFKIVTERLSEVAGNLSNPALNALLLKATVDGDEGFQVHTGVGLSQTVEERSVIGRHTEGLTEEVRDVATTGLGTNIRDCPLTQRLVQPGGIGRRPALVIGNTIGQTTEPQQALAEVSQFEGAKGMSGRLGQTCDVRDPAPGLDNDVAVGRINQF